mgnify:CR=1 FL=1
MKMILEDLRKKALYQNSIEIWIGISEEKTLDWFNTENYQKFIAFLLKNELNMKQMTICFDESDKHVETIMAEVTNTPWNERHCYIINKHLTSNQLSNLKAELKKLRDDPYEKGAFRLFAFDHWITGLIPDTEKGPVSH